jgi:hypothetical protein
MTVADIGQFITTVGFPVAAYAGMFYYLIKRDDHFMEVIDKLRSSIDELKIFIARGCDDGK